MENALTSHPSFSKTNTNRARSRHNSCKIIRTHCWPIRVPAGQRRCNPNSPSTSFSLTHKHKCWPPLYSPYPWVFIHKSICNLKAQTQLEKNMHSYNHLCTTIILSLQPTMLIAKIYLKKQNKREAFGQSWDWPCWGQLLPELEAVGAAQFALWESSQWRREAEVSSWLKSSNQTATPLLGTGGCSSWCTLVPKPLVVLTATCHLDRQCRGCSTTCCAHRCWTSPRIAEINWVVLNRIWEEPFQLSLIKKQLKIAIRYQS
jgi:hypothetical protein